MLLMLLGLRLLGNYTLMPDHRPQEIQATSVAGQLPGSDI